MSYFAGLGSPGASDGDFLERDGRRYAVLFDVDRKLVAAYAIVGDRLKRAPLASLACA
jgi:hypothetical protein